MEALIRNGEQFPNFMKKGSHYTFISTTNFVFNDTIRFTSPCRYAQYLKQWGVEESKSVFPYEKFSSVEQLALATDFPLHEEFYSNLTQSNIPIDDYEVAKSEYKRRYGLPDGHPDKMTCMLDWLGYYNKLDVQPLVEAMSRSFQCFYQHFEQDANTFMSLPGIASAALYRNFDQSCSYIYSFRKKDNDIRALHRSKIIGGLVNVFHRNVNLKVSPKYSIYIHIYIYIYIYK